MEMDEIRKKVKVEKAEEWVEKGEGLGEEELIAVCGESDDEEFLGFEDDEIDEVEADANEGMEVEFLVEGVPLDIDPRVEMKDEVDTWREGDGSRRLLTNEEKEVVALLRKVQGDRKWDDFQI